MINTVVAPGSATGAETFVWYEVNGDLKLGVAHLAKQGAFRVLGSYRLLRETPNRPSVHAGVGVQGIGTGNPGYNVRAEKMFHTPAGEVSTYAGIGFRSNENHAHCLGGAKIRLGSCLALGVQIDGHQTNPFATVSKGPWTVGVFLIEGKSLAYLAAVRF